MLIVPEHLHNGFFLYILFQKIPKDSAGICTSRVTVSVLLTGVR